MSRSDPLASETTLWYYLLTNHHLTALMLNASVLAQVWTDSSIVYLYSCIVAYNINLRRHTAGAGGLGCGGTFPDTTSLYYVTSRQSEGHNRYI